MSLVQLYLVGMGKGKAKSKPKSKPLMQEVATTIAGRDITRGYVRGLLPSQDEILTRKGYGDLKLYEEILQDDQVHSCFQQRRSAVIASERSCQPGGEKRIDRQAAEHLWSQTEPHWDSAVDKQLYATWYGYSFAEMMYDVADGRVCLDGIKVRNRRRFKFWEDHTPRLITVGNYHGEPLPERKFWQVTTGADNDDEPYGRGLASFVYWPWWCKRNGLEFWSIFLEKFAAPTGVGTYDPQVHSAEEQQKLLDVIDEIRIKSGIVLPRGMAIEFMEATRSGTADYQAFVNRMDAQIAKVILSQTMTTDDGSSRSQAEVHAGVAFQVVKRDADLICQSFNQGPGRWLTEWNFPGAAVPQIWFNLEQAEDVNARVNRDKVLFDMGYRLTPEAVEEIYGPHYVLPDEGLLMPGDAPVVDASPQEFAEPEPGDDVDAIAAKLATEGQPSLDQWLAVIKSRLEAGTGDLADFAAELTQLYPELPSAEFAALMGEALSLSRLVGGTNVGPNVEA